MNSPLMLTFDFGTQSMRAMVFDKQGQLLGKHKVIFDQPHFSLQPGYAEQHPSYFFEKLCEAAQGLKKTIPDLWPHIIGVTLTTIRDTAVCLDHNYQVLRPAILWHDQRSNDAYKQFPLFNKLAYLVSGMYETARDNSQQTKANWIRLNEPHIWQKTYKYVMISTYLNYCLTGVLKDSVAAQIARIPFDYPKKRWMKKSHLNYAVFNIEASKMPDIVDPGQVIGTITANASFQTGIPAGLPLIATGSDKGCETAGTGAIAPHVANLSFGTAATVQISTKKYFEPQLFLPSYPAVLAGWYNAEYQIYRGYWMVTWFKKEFAEKEVQQALVQGVSPEELLNLELEKIPPGADGLVLQPFWGAGLKIPEAKGAIIGFSDVHTRGHIYRAIIEGIGFALREAMERMARRSHQAIHFLTVSGGGSQSDAICQLTADLFNLDVYRVQTYETSGLGSSLIGFLGLNEFSSYEAAVQAMVHYGKIFHPQAHNRQTYDFLYHNVYKKMYAQLKSLYRTMQHRPH